PDPPRTRPIELTEATNNARTQSTIRIVVWLCVRCEGAGQTNTDSPMLISRISATSQGCPNSHHRKLALFASQKKTPFTIHVAAVCTTVQDETTMTAARMHQTARRATRRGGFELTMLLTIPGSRHSVGSRSSTGVGEK